MAEQASRARRRSAWIVVALTAVALVVAALWLLLPIRLG
jgi:succinate dehydrogenase hydrophobic anchor subunit